MRLTIFTPTYNREKYLNRLYESLVQQTNKSFEWIIVDDGSTDNTKNVIKKFMLENKIRIKYYIQKNSGKHVAHNKGVEMCNSELFYCVDSDDYLPNNAIMKILDIWDKRDTNIEYTGIVGLKGYKDGRIMGGEFQKNIRLSTLSDLYNIYGKKGETALIFKTEYLKRNKFPVYEEEKFLSEEVVYNELDKIAPLIIENTVIYIMEYLNDGLTNNYLKAWSHSPRGVLTLLKSRYERARSIDGVKKYYRCCKVILIFNAFCIYKNINIFDDTPNKILSTILLPISLLVKKVKFKGVE